MIILHVHHLTAATFIVLDNRSNSKIMGHLSGSIPGGVLKVITHQHKCLGNFVDLLNKRYLVFITYVWAPIFMSRCQNRNRPQVVCGYFSNMRKGK
jgi:hypothetical protein